MKVQDVIAEELSVKYDRERCLMVTWNNSATFNVYRVDEDTSEVEAVDCFTVYGIDSHDKAREQAQDYLDNLE